MNLTNLLRKLVMIVSITLALASCTLHARADRPTRVYGSAYVKWWDGFEFYYTPFVHVYVFDQRGNQIGDCYTDIRSDFWLDNVHPKQTIYIYARGGIYDNRSTVVSQYVPERPYWQLNQTRMPDCVCRY